MGGEKYDQKTDQPGRGEIEKTAFSDGSDQLNLWIPALAKSAGSRGAPHLAE